MLLQGGHFDRNDPTFYGGEGGRRNGEIVKKRPSVPLLLTRIVAPDDKYVDGMECKMKIHCTFIDTTHNCTGSILADLSLGITMTCTCEDGPW